MDVSRAGAALAGLALLGVAAYAAWFDDERGFPFVRSSDGPSFAGKAEASTDSLLPSAFAVPAQPPAAVAPEPFIPLAPEPWAEPPPAVEGAGSGPEVGALAAIVIDEASAAVLYEKDGHTPLPPASLTKIATAILAIKRLPLDQWVTTDVDSRIMRGSTVMGLVPGDQFTVMDLLYGMMLPSGNDAALALARASFGSDAAFVTEMNAFAKNIGLRETTFVNPHGLGRNMVSAHDLAMLTRYAMQLETFRILAATTVAQTDGPRPLRLYNLNGFLHQYAGADGVKIGYTRSAGQTLVASATRNGHRLIAVILNSPNKEADAARLLDWAFANHTWP